MHTFWVTFYSYKGGVGRSMALANVAAHLASAGRRVLMIDFDLEAPGLDAFEDLKLKQGEQGLVEYVYEYLETDVAPSIADYVQEVKSEHIRSGKLWVMHAGKKDEKYNRLRSGINWDDLYESRDGVLFFENFKADIHQNFHPDYVFVDSRTGLTDVGGVCTLHLPNLVVLLFSLNEQNLQGVSSVARVLRAAESPPLLLPVATPVPNLPRERDELLRNRFARAKELLGSDIKHSITYSSQVSLKESIVVWSDLPRLVSEYQDISKSITDADPRGIDFLIRQSQGALDNLDISRAQEICAALELEYPDRPDAWLQIAEAKRLDKDIEGYEGALQRAIELDPNNTEIFRKLFSLLVTQAQYAEATSLGDKVLSCDGGLSDQTRYSVLGSMGEVYMRVGNFKNAADKFSEQLKISLKIHKNDEDRFVPLFNSLESSRRAGYSADFSQWLRVIGIYENTMASAGSVDIARVANQMQAMHIAYAMVDDIAEAGNLLRDVRRMIENVSPRERIFSVATYSHLSREEFIALNNEMITKLAEGRLWDGYMLNASR